MWQDCADTGILMRIGQVDAYGEAMARRTQTDSLEARGMEMTIVVRRADEGSWSDLRATGMLRVSPNAAWAPRSAGR